MTIIIAVKTEDGVLMASDMAETVDVRDSHGNLLETVLCGYSDKIRPIANGYAAGIAGSFDSAQRAFDILSAQGIEAFIREYPKNPFILSSHLSIEHSIGAMHDRYCFGIGAGFFPEVHELVKRGRSHGNAAEVLRSAVHLSKEIGADKGLIIDGFLAYHVKDTGLEVLERNMPD